jgi:hypothetical protein
VVFRGPNRALSAVGIFYMRWNEVSLQPKFRCHLEHSRALLIVHPDGVNLDAVGPEESTVFRKATDLCSARKLTSGWRLIYPPQQLIWKYRVPAEHAFGNGPV